MTMPFDLRAAAEHTMREAGFEPTLPPDARAEARIELTDMCVGPEYFFPR